MADMPWEHAAEARAALNAIVTDPEHGVAALSSPRTMSNLLKDLLPDAPREKNLLVAAAEAGLADKLRGHVAEGMDSSTAIRLTASTFSDSTPLTPDACSWVAGEIAVALGISTPADIAEPGATAASSGQTRSAPSAASGPVGSSMSEAPTREHARPGAQGFGSAGAQGPGQAAAGSSGQAWAASSDQPSGGQGPGPQSDPGYPEAQVQSHPQGPASFQKPTDYPQAGYPQTSSADQLPADQLPADQLPADQLPADQLPAGRIPADQLPAGRARLAGHWRIRGTEDE